MSQAEATVNEYQRRILYAMDWISRNLDGPVSVASAAAAANFSKFHFNRIFKAITGESVGEHVRRLRLERAACLLSWRPDKNITEIALDCGFSSSQNFAKAFRKHFAESPSGYREKHSPFPGEGDSGNGAQKAAVLPPSHRLSREELLCVGIEEIPALEVAYVRKIGVYEEAAMEGMEQLHQVAASCGFSARGRFYGIPWDDPNITPEALCRYDACLAFPKGIPVPDALCRQEIVGGTYAVLHGEVTWEEIGDLFTFLLRDWLPVSGYQPADGPCFERFWNDGSIHPEKIWIMDICFPVRPL